VSRSLELYRSLPRYLAARAVSGKLPGMSATSAAPLRLTDGADPVVPDRSGWVRVRVLLSGICGSDLATVTGRSSLYFSPLVSWPFVPGHEVVGVLEDTCDDLPAGTRVVLDPVLTCAARGVAPCEACRSGRRGRCDQIATGHLAAGLQTGYCADTGGGWGRVLVAHRSQLHVVPQELPDERAVLVEPLACAVHTARRAAPDPGQHVLIVGAGSVGLFTLLALRALTPAGQITVVAKHARQVELARRFGATDVLAPREAVGGVRRATRAFRLKPERGGEFLLGGVDVGIDCAGTSASLSTVLRTTRAGGRVVLSGMPSAGGSADLTPLWFRELELAGSYATAGDDFADAMALAGGSALDGVLSATYPLARWQEALDHALSAGRLGAIKIAFDPGAAA
jgi:threonine dehydrogenase-like Zn-dependent dehydrogenase